MEVYVCIYSILNYIYINHLYAHAQTDVQMGDKEGQRGGILLRAIHPSAAQLPAVHLVRPPGGELRVGEPARGHHQRLGHPARGRVHRHIPTVRTGGEEGKSKSKCWLELLLCC
jgi:hypothetical protein